MKITSRQFFIEGFIFAVLWSSASVAAKFGLRSLDPLTLFQFRFLLGSILMLGYAFLFQNDNIPTRQEWLVLSVFGFFNITLYLSFFVLAIAEVTAGIGSLSTALNPLLMSILGGIFFKKAIHKGQVYGLLLGILGVVLAVWPLLQNSHATLKGLFFLLISMLSYSVAALYFSDKVLTINRFALNGWQTFLGGLFMLPATLLLAKKPFHLDSTAVMSLIWLSVMVSTIAVNIWIRLIKIDAVRASFFLFLAPVFGYLYASVLLNEPFTWHSLVGLILVVFGLYLGSNKPESPNE